MRARLLPLAAALAAPLVVSACGGDSPVAPSRESPAPSVSATAPPLEPFELSGLVTDGDGRPVAGAEVTVLPSLGTHYGNPVSVETDKKGAYAIRVEAARGWGGTAADVVGKRFGYEPYVGSIVAREEKATKNFRLYRLRRITAGESTHVVVAPDDTMCGFLEDWVCRVVRVTSPRGGMLTIEAIPDPGAPPLAGMEIYVGAHSDVAPRQTIAVSAGQEVPVGVGIHGGGTAPAGYTVRTSLAE